MARTNVRRLPARVGAGALLGLVALAACGRENVRFVEHQSAPESIESYAEQLGAKVDTVEQTFMSSKIEHADLQLALGSGQVEQKVTMRSADSDQSVSYTQATRPQVMDLFQQGSTGSSQTDNFVQNSDTGGVLDILVVVDDSPSMAEEQANLSTKLAPLLSYVSDSNWRIAVNTTDPAAGCMRAIINKGDANYQSAFASAVMPGIKGSGNERGILQAVNGLSDNCMATPWLRPNSTLAVLIISDEDNCSNGTQCGEDPWKHGAYLTNYLASIRSVGTNARVYGLVWHASQARDQCSTAVHRADIYSSVITATGGKWGSVCSNNYTNTLSSISQDISIILKSQFALSYAPVPGSAVVHVNGQLRTSGYTITGNVIQFSTPPAVGASISVAYLHGATEMKKKFVLSQPAHNSGIEVMLDSAVADPSAYVFNAAQNAIEFTNAPSCNSVRVSYKKNVDLLSQFAIGSGAAPASVKAFVNGAQVSNFTVDYAQGLVKFAQAPAESSAIKIDYAKIGEPVLSYPVLVSGDTISVLDDTTGAQIGHSFANGKVTFAASEFVSGRVIALTIENVSGDHNLVVLTKEPRAGSLKVTGPSGVCPNAAISGSQLNLAACGYQAGAEVKVEFDYVTDKMNTFEITEVALSTVAKQQWKVLVAGEERKDYTRDGNKVTFASLPDAVEVKIEVRFIRN